MSDGSASDASRASRRFAHGKHSQAGVPELLTSSASSAPLPRFRPLAQLLRAELDVLYAVQRTRRMLPHALRWLCDRLISSHPFYDVSIAVWMTTPFALAAYGWVLWWLLVLNVAVAFSLHWALDAPSPADLDARLRPRARLSPSGFPCMEVQLATALLAYIAWWHASALVWCGCALAVGALVLLRVYALTHFPHQLALSVALGGFSVPAGRAVARYFFKARLHPQMHGLGVVFVMFIVAGFVAYHAETNSVPFMRIPRSEYVRVLDNIISSSEPVSEFRVRRRRGAEGESGVPASVAPGSGGRSFPPAGPLGYAPVGPASAGRFDGGGAPSFPPAGPTNAFASATSFERPARPPRDSLYYLLRQGQEGGVR